MLARLGGDTEQIRSALMLSQFASARPPSSQAPLRRSSTEQPTIPLTKDALVFSGQPQAMQHQQEQGEQPQQQIARVQHTPKRRGPQTPATSEAGSRPEYKPYSRTPTQPSILQEYQRTLLAKTPPSTPSALAPKSHTSATKRTAKKKLLTGAVSISSPKCCWHSLFIPAYLFKLGSQLSVDDSRPNLIEVGHRYIDPNTFVQVRYSLTPNTIYLCHLTFFYSDSLKPESIYALARAWMLAPSSRYFPDFLN